MKPFTKFIFVGFIVSFVLLTVLGLGIWGSMTYRNNQPALPVSTATQVVIPVQTGADVSATDITAQQTLISQRETAYQTEIGKAQNQSQTYQQAIIEAEGQLQTLQEQIKMLEETLAIRQETYANQLAETERQLNTQRTALETERNQAQQILNGLSTN